MKNPNHCINTLIFNCENNSLLIPFNKNIESKSL